MSAFSRLWHRAPLWRFAFCSSVFFSAATLLYPAPWLLRAAPPFKSLTQRIDHFFGRDASPSGNDADMSQDAAANPSPQAGQTDGDVSGAIPPIDADLRDLLPFSGRQIPLPAGTWHPVVTTQIGSHREVTRNVLVRTDRGVVTGVMMVQASQSSIPPEAAEDLDALCHDDRNYMRRVLQSDKAGETCVATSPAVLATENVSNAPDVNWAFGRLRVLGFPMPPIMVQAAWVHIVPSADGGINFARVNIALSPAEQGSTKVPGVLDDWDKPGAGTSPFSSRFVTAVNQWLLDWAPVLLDGYERKLKPMDGIRAGSEDPAFHHW